MAKFIAEVMGRELKYELVGLDANRPGHDLRYGACTREYGSASYS